MHWTLPYADCDLSLHQSLQFKASRRTAFVWKPVYDKQKLLTGLNKAMKATRPAQLIGAPVWHLGNVPRINIVCILGRMNRGTQQYISYYYIGSSSAWQSHCIFRCCIHVQQHVAIGFNTLSCIRYRAAGFTIACDWQTSFEHFHTPEPGQQKKIRGECCSWSSTQL